MHRKLLHLCLAVLSLFLLAGFAQAQVEENFWSAGSVRYINPTTGSNAQEGSSARPWRTIAHAISQQQGALMLWLYPGTHTLAQEIEVTDFSLALLGLGSGGQEEGETIIDMDGTGRLLSTLTGNKTASVVLGHLTVINGKAEYGGVLQLTGSVYFNAFDVTFRNNLASEDGGVVYFMAGPTTTMEFNDCVFEDNEARNGGAAVLDLFGGAQAFFTGCTFARNRARFVDNKGAGGALWVANGALDLKGCTFDQNYAPVVGGAIFSRTAEMWLSETTFTRNTADREGGAAVALSAGAKAYADRIEVKANTGGARGAVAVGASCTFNAFRSTFADNEGVGVAARGSGASLLIEDCLFQHHSGPAALMEGNSDWAVFRNTLFRFNSNREGGGAAMLLLSSSPAILNCHFEGNLAHKGGAVLVSGRSFPLFNNTVFENNTVVSPCSGSLHFDNETSGSLNLVLVENYKGSRFPVFDASAFDASLPDYVSCQKPPKKGPPTSPADNMTEAEYDAFIEMWEIEQQQGAAQQQGGATVAFSVARRLSSSSLVAPLASALLLLMGGDLRPAPLLASLALAFAASPVSAGKLSQPSMFVLTKTPTAYPTPIKIGNTPTFPFSPIRSPTRFPAPPTQQPTNLPTPGTTPFRIEIGTWSAGPWYLCTGEPLVCNLKDKGCQSTTPCDEVWTRDVTCSTAICSQLVKPATTMKCATCSSWVYEPWSACDAACEGTPGSVKQRRQAIGCTITKTDTTTYFEMEAKPTVPPEPEYLLCFTANGAPVTEQACSLPTCPFVWRYSPYGECDSVCEAGTQTRTTLGCMYSNGETISATTPCTATAGAQVTTRACLKPDCMYTWVHSGESGWGACQDVQCNGEGKQSRAYVCKQIGLGGSGAVVAESNCELVQPADDVRQCEGPGAPDPSTCASWRGGPFGACFAHCHAEEGYEGWTGDNQRWRPVECVKADGTIVNEYQCAYSSTPRVPENELCLETAPNVAADNQVPPCNPDRAYLFLGHQPWMTRHWDEPVATSAVASWGDSLLVEWTSLYVPLSHTLSLELVPAADSETAQAGVWPLLAVPEIFNTGQLLWLVDYSIPVGLYKLRVYSRVDGVEALSPTFQIKATCGGNNDCQNGGQCVEGACQCVGSFEGTHCEVPKALALEVMCRNAGVYSPGTSECSCIAGYSGVECEKRPNSPCSDCQQGGLVVESHNAAGSLQCGCVCPGFWVGKTCSTCILDEWVCGARGSAKKDGTCSKCECEAGFTGQSCEIHYIDVQVKVSPAGLDDATRAFDQQRFEGLLAADIAYALEIDSEQVQVQSISKSTGVVKLWLLSGDSQWDFSREASALNNGDLGNAQRLSDELEQHVEDLGTAKGRLSHGTASQTISAAWGYKAKDNARSILSVEEESSSLAVALILVLLTLVLCVGACCYCRKHSLYKKPLSMLLKLKKKNMTAEEVEMTNMEADVSSKTVEETLGIKAEYEKPKCPCRVCFCFNWCCCCRCCANKKVRIGLYVFFAALVIYLCYLAWAVSELLKLTELKEDLQKGLSVTIPDLCSSTIPLVIGMFLDSPSAISVGLDAAIIKIRDPGSSYDILHVVLERDDAFRITKGPQEYELRAHVEIKDLPGTGRLLAKLGDKARPLFDLEVEADVTVFTNALLFPVSKSIAVQKVLTMNKKEKEAKAKPRPAAIHNVHISTPPPTPGGSDPRRMDMTVNMTVYAAENPKMPLELDIALPSITIGVLHEDHRVALVQTVPGTYANAATLQAQASVIDLGQDEMTSLHHLLNAFLDPDNFPGDNVTIGITGAPDGHPAASSTCMVQLLLQAMPEFLVEIPLAQDCPPGDLRINEFNGKAQVCDILPISQVESCSPCKPSKEQKLELSAPQPMAALAIEPRLISRKLGVGDRSEVEAAIALRQQLDFTLTTDIGQAIEFNFFSGSDVLVEAYVPSLRVDAADFKVTAGVRVPDEHFAFERLTSMKASGGPASLGLRLQGKPSTFIGEILVALNMEFPPEAFNKTGEETLPEGVIDTEAEPKLFIDLIDRPGLFEIVLKAKPTPLPNGLEVYIPGGAIDMVDVNRANPTAGNSMLSINLPELHWTEKWAVANENVPQELARITMSLEQGTNLGKFLSKFLADEPVILGMKGEANDAGAKPGWAEGLLLSIFNLPTRISHLTALVPPKDADDPETMSPEGAKAQFENMPVFPSKVGLHQLFRSETLAYISIFVALRVNLPIEITGTLPAISVDVDVDNANVARVATSKMVFDVTEAASTVTVFVDDQTMLLKAIRQEQDPDKGYDIAISGSAASGVLSNVLKGMEFTFRVDPAPETEAPTASPTVSAPTSAPTRFPTPGVSVPSSSVVPPFFRDKSAKAFLSQEMASKFDIQVRKPYLNRGLPLEKKPVIRSTVPDPNAQTPNSPFDLMVDIVDDSQLFSVTLSATLVRDILTSIPMDVFVPDFDIALRCNFKTGVPVMMKLETRGININHSESMAGTGPKRLDNIIKLSMTKTQGSFVGNFLDDILSGKEAWLLVDSITLSEDPLPVMAQFGEPSISAEALLDKTMLMQEKAPPPSQLPPAPPGPSNSPLMLSRVNLVHLFLNNSWAEVAITLQGFVTMSPNVHITAQLDPIEVQAFQKTASGQAYWLGSVTLHLLPLEIKDGNAGHILLGTGVEADPAALIDLSGELQELIETETVHLVMVGVSGSSTSVLSTTLAYTHFDVHIAGSKPCTPILPVSPVKDFPFDTLRPRFDAAARATGIFKVDKVNLDGASQGLGLPAAPADFVNAPPMAVPVFVVDKNTITSLSTLTDEFKRAGGGFKLGSSDRRKGFDTSDTGALDQMDASQLVEIALISDSAKSMSLDVSGAIPPQTKLGDVSVLGADFTIGVGQLILDILHNEEDPTASIWQTPPPTASPSSIYYASPGTSANEQGGFTFISPKDLQATATPPTPMFKPWRPDIPVLTQPKDVLAKRSLLSETTGSAKQRVSHSHNFNMGVAGEFIHMENAESESVGLHTRNLLEFSSRRTNSAFNKGSKFGAVNAPAQEILKGDGRGVNMGNIPPLFSNGLWGSPQQKYLATEGYGGLSPYVARNDMKNKIIGAFALNELHISAHASTPVSAELRFTQEDEGEWLMNTIGAWFGGEKSLPLKIKGSIEQDGLHAQAGTVRVELDLEKDYAEGIVVFVKRPILPFVPEMEPTFFLPIGKIPSLKSINIYKIKPQAIRPVVRNGKSVLNVNLSPVGDPAKVAEGPVAQKVTLVGAGSTLSNSETEATVVSSSTKYTDLLDISVEEAVSTTTLISSVNNDVEDTFNPEVSIQTKTIAFPGTSQAEPTPAPTRRLWGRRLLEEATPEPALCGSHALNHVVEDSNSKDPTSNGIMQIVSPGTACQPHHAHGLTVGAATHSHARRLLIGSTSSTSSSKRQSWDEAPSVLIGAHAVEPLAMQHKAAGAMHQRRLSFETNKWRGYRAGHGRQASDAALQHAQRRRLLSVEGEPVSESHRRLTEKDSKLDVLHHHAQPVHMMGLATEPSSHATDVHLGRIPGADSLAAGSHQASLGSPLSHVRDAVFSKRPTAPSQLLRHLHGASSHELLHAARPLEPHEEEHPQAKKGHRSLLAAAHSSLHAAAETVGQATQRYLQEHRIRNELAAAAHEQHAKEVEAEWTSLSIWMAEHKAKEQRRLQLHAETGQGVELPPLRVRGDRSVLTSPVDTRDDRERLQRRLEMRQSNVVWRTAAASATAGGHAKAASARRRYLKEGPYSLPPHSSANPPPHVFGKPRLQADTLEERLQRSAVHSSRRRLGAVGDQNINRISDTCLDLDGALIHNQGSVQGMSKLSCAKPPPPVEPAKPVIGLKLVLIGDPNGNPIELPCVLPPPLCSEEALSDFDSSTSKIQVGAIVELPWDDFLDFPLKVTLPKMQGEVVCCGSSVAVAAELGVLNFDTRVKDEIEPVATIHFPNALVLRQLMADLSDKTSATEITVRGSELLFDKNWGSNDADKTLLQTLLHAFSMDIAVNEPDRCDSVGEEEDQELDEKPDLTFLTLAETSSNEAVFNVDLDDFLPDPFKETDMPVAIDLGEVAVEVLYKEKVILRVVLPIDLQVGLGNKLDALSISLQGTESLDSYCESYWDDKGGIPTPAGVDKRTCYISEFVRTVVKQALETYKDDLGPAIRVRLAFDNYYGVRQSLFLKLRLFSQDSSVRGAALVDSKTKSEKKRGQSFCGEVDSDAANMEPDKNAGEDGVVLQVMNGKRLEFPIPNAWPLCEFEARLLGFKPLYDLMTADKLDDIYNALSDVISGGLSAGQLRFGLEIFNPLNFPFTLNTLEVGDVLLRDPDGHQRDDLALFDNTVQNFLGDARYANLNFMLGMSSGPLSRVGLSGNGLINGQSFGDLSVNLGVSVSNIKEAVLRLLDELNKKRMCLRIAAQVQIQIGNSFKLPLPVDLDKMSIFKGSCEFAPKCIPQFENDINESPMGKNSGRWQLSGGESEWDDDDYFSIDKKNHFGSVWYKYQRNVFRSFKAEFDVKWDFYKSPIDFDTSSKSGAAFVISSQPPITRDDDEDAADKYLGGFDNLQSGPGYDNLAVVFKKKGASSFVGLFYDSEEKPLAKASYDWNSNSNHAVKVLYIHEKRMLYVYINGNVVLNVYVNLNDPNACSTGQCIYYSTNFLPGSNYISDAAACMGDDWQTLGYSTVGRPECEIARQAGSPCLFMQDKSTSVCGNGNMYLGFTKFKKNPTQLLIKNFKFSSHVKFNVENTQVVLDGGVAIYEDQVLGRANTQITMDVDLRDSCGEPIRFTNLNFPVDKLYFAKVGGASDGLTVPPDAATWYSDVDRLGQLQVKFTPPQEGKWQLGIKYTTNSFLAVSSQFEAEA